VHVHVHVHVYAHVHVHVHVHVHALQLLVEILSEQLVRLPVRFEDVEIPLWAESAEDYKSSVVQFRSQVRLWEFGQGRGSG
jgi:hypothetical protein